MLEIKFTNQMKRDFRRQVKRGKNPSLLEGVLDSLAKRIPLAVRYKDHELTGDWSGYRECHIENDWLLIYTINEKELILVATRTGSHADFGW
ncbi:MAG: type II toxin-antitoxin system YafQ family toxin [Spirochaetales bacterium]|jgi:mRNA interferase YafQ|nr:type II toxin-antitoxin system YafQ family toxin [Spirochaetales bacterium]